MSIGRIVLFPLVFAGVLAVAGAADAQFGNLLKKKVSGSTQPQVAPPKAAFCDDITAEDIDRFLKAAEIERAAYEREMAAAEKLMAAARAEKADADAALARRAEGMVATMMETAECKDGFAEKDPRSKEVARLYDLAANASARGNERQSEKYNDEASKLEQAIDIDADKACGGKGSSLLVDCLARRKSEDPRAAERDALLQKANDAAKKGNQAASQQFAAQAQQISAFIEMEAVGVCNQQMLEAQAGGSVASEQAASDEASRRMQEASSAAGQAAAQKAAETAAKETGFSGNELYRLRECIFGRINQSDQTPMNSTSASSIDGRKGELKKAMGI